jgi:hypothetical protein
LLTLDRPPATCATVSATQKARKFYTADSRGFRVQSNNFPVTPAQIEDTPEEPAAKTEFAIKSALNLLLPRKPLPRPPVLSANSTHVLQSLRTTINVISTCPLLWAAPSRAQNVHSFPTTIMVIIKKYLSGVVTHFYFLTLFFPVSSLHHRIFKNSKKIKTFRPIEK